MDADLNFVAIDFETANRSPASPCQLAAVQIEKGEIKQERCWLIRPQRMYFAPQNIAIHGIRPEDVKDQPQFDQLWSEIHQWLDGRIIVAHNAPFDIGVMVHTLTAYDIACPPLTFNCTRLIAQRSWPGQTGYGLKVLAERLGIKFRHHDALEDARTCAKVAIQAAQDMQAASMEHLEQLLFIQRGSISLGSISNPRCTKRSRSQWPSRSNSSSGDSGFSATRRGWPSSSPKVSLELNSETVQRIAGDEKPLQGRVVVFTGRLLGLPRQQAMELASSLGATCEDQVTDRTDYLVMGQPDDQWPQGASLVQQFAQRSAVPTPTRDRPIRMLSERQFAQLLPGGQAAFAVRYQSRSRS